MELELEFRDHRTILWGLVLLLVLVGLGAYGRVMTPTPPRVLTWDDWRYMAVQREYARQITAMRKDAETLAALLSDRGDPLRIAWEAEQIARRWEKARVLETLSVQRDILVASARAIQAWSAGQQSLQEAQEALQSALEALSE